jgi:hypothetical protein
MPALVIGAVYVLHVLVALREAEGQRRRRSILQTAATALDSALCDGALAVSGLIRGLPTTFTLRGDTGHVEIDVPACDLMLAIQPRLVPARSVIEPGVVRTGDAVFDDALYVEGAPADVVRCLLSPELRARLVDGHPLELAIRGSTIEASAPLRGPGDVRPLLDLAGALAAGIPAAVEEADLRLTEVAGSPYRPEIDATSVRAAQAGRVEEVAALVELMRDRAAAARRALLLATVLGAILVISLYASGG